MRILCIDTGKVHELDPRKNGENSGPCPKCAETRKHPKAKSFSWNQDKKTGYCQNCNAKFVEYKPLPTEKQYAAPVWKNKTGLTDHAIKYIEGRGINQDAVNYFRVYSDTEFMPQHGKDCEVICFPYFYNEELINIKYRGPLKSFKLFKDARLIWFNQDAVTAFPEIIITEGEFDAMACYVAGFKNVVSVPNGANKVLAYLDDTIHLFEGKTVILAVDNDGPGYELRCELMRRFGNENCKIVDFKDCKDANEYLLKYGGLGLQDAINAAEVIPVDGIIDLQKNYDAIYDLYLNGLRPGFGINDELDNVVTWETKRLAVWTGIPSHGKSEVLDWVNVKMNMVHGHKVGYFSPENYPVQYHYAKIAEKITGQRFSSKSLDQAEFAAVHEYIKQNFFFIYPEDNFKLDTILEKAKYLVRTQGIRIFVIDPWNKIEHHKQGGENETDYTSRVLDVLSNFAKRNDILFHVVAHPRKMDRDSTRNKYEKPNLYDINGSAAWYNKVDFGVCIYRERDEQDPHTQIHVLKVKFKHLGQGGQINKKYNYNNGRYELYDSMPDQWNCHNWLFNTATNDMPVSLEFDFNTNEIAPF
jgi:twinkle protein